MSKYCEICKINSYEITNHKSELDNVKEAVYSCSSCQTQYCEEHYRESGHNNSCPIFDQMMGNIRKK